MPAKDFTADYANINESLVRCRPSLSREYSKMNEDDDLSEDEYAVSFTFPVSDTSRTDSDPATRTHQLPADKEQHVVNGNRPSQPGQDLSPFKRKLLANDVLVVTVLVIFLVLDLLLIGRLVFVVVNARSGASDDEAPVGWSHLADAPFCLPCSQVYMNAFEVEKNQFKLNVTSDEEGGMTLCCAAQHDDLDQLIKAMYVRVRYSSDRARGVTANETEADDVRGQVFKLDALIPAGDKEFGSPNREVVVPFIPESSEDSSVGASLLVMNNTVAIQQRGHYYVYSQVPFKFSNQSLAMTQQVCRIRNDGREDVMLENSVYPCDVTPSCLHSFASGMLLLEKGDAISLKISHEKCLDRTKPINFGVHHV